MKTLVVDDSGAMRRIIIHDLLKFHKTEIREAENGIEAMKVLETYEPDLIVTDWYMPEMDGLDFVRKVRESRHKDVAILMVTTNHDKDNIVIALRNGVDHYLIKPFTPKKLLEKVNYILKRRQETREKGA